MGKKAPRFADARRHALVSLAAVYRLLQFAGPKLGNQDALFRECVADLKKHLELFRSVYDTVRPMLVKAIPDPNVVSLCREHELYAFDIVAPVCRKVLGMASNYVDNDNGWKVWQSMIRGKQPALIVPSLDDIFRLDTHLRREISCIDGAQTKAAAKPKRPGRKKADYHIEQWEAKIAADWQRAHKAGTYKVEFAREKGMKPADLDKLLDRVAARNKAAAQCNRYSE